MWVERIPGRTPALLVLCLFLLLPGMFPRQDLRAQTPPAQAANAWASSRDHQKIAATGVNVPLFFEANKGQTDPRVKFLTHSSGYTMFLTPTETVLAESTAPIHENGTDNVASAMKQKASAAAVIRMELLGANRAPEVTGLGELPGQVNYLIGNNPRSWHTGVSLYSQVRTEQVYPGVDLLFHGDQKQLEYDFVVSPGADASRIGFRIRGAVRLELDPQGDLILHTADSSFRMHKPVIYQAVGSERRPIEGGFVRKGKYEVGFRLGVYDRNQVLVIDPAIGYATFLGGSGDDQPSDLAVDDSNPAAPKLYVTGFTSSITTFPQASNPLIGNTGGQIYGFIAKIDPTITTDPGGAASLDYLTFIGGGTPFSGNSCQSAFAKISLDKSQGASGIQPVVTGLTGCSDYPGTKIQPVTGGLANVATRLTVSGAAIDASVVLGGNGTTDGSFSSVDSSGNVLISGATSSTNLPTTTGAYMTTFNNGGAGTHDCFVAKLPRSGLTPPSYLTYLNTGGGSTTGSHVGCGAIEDSTGKIDAGGNTVSATAFHVGAGGANLANGFQPTFQGTQDTFGMRLDPSQSGTAELLYATYYGGGGVTNATSGALDLGNGVVAIGGFTTSNGGTNAPNIPLQNAFQSTNLAAASGGETGFLVVFDTQQTGAGGLLCSTYFGGSSGSDEVHAVTYDAGDPTAFRIILGGQTRSGTDFPTLNSLQAFQGVQDGFISSLKVPLATQTFKASLYFSSYIGGGAQSSGESERITGVGVDTNHAIYATGRTISTDFFGNLTTPTIVNGFQTTCTSCGGNPPLDDVVVFSVLTTPGATLQSISITPASATVTVGQTQQFDAQGFFSDGTIQDITTAVSWSSSNTSAAIMSSTTPGLATTAGLMPGSTSISASLSGINSLNSPTLTVNSAAGNFTLNIVPASGATGGGNVSDSTGAINCNLNGTSTPTGKCSASFASGSQITLTATPGANSAFGSWSGTPTLCTVTAGACTFSMPAAAETVTAAFNLGTGSNPVLAVTKTHTGNFTQGQNGATYTVTVSDQAGAGPTNGTVTVTDTIPTGLTLTSMAGTGWTCTANSCTRSDVLAAGASYPAITVTVSVASNAPASVVNAVSASGGGSATANATDTTTITSGTGTGNGVATVTPSSFAFGGVQLGASVTQTFSLSNTGTGALGNIVISISGVASFGSLDYAITSNTCPASLAVNSAPCTFTVSFTPIFAAPDPGSVVITDDSTVGPTTILLSGTGVASVYVLPFEIFYDGQTPGTTSPAQTATLFNVSDSPVGVNGITFVGNAASDFSLVNNQCVNSLSSGSNCTMGVTFKPSTSALGPRTADLTIATNATGGPLVSHLTGNGAIRHLPGFTANVLPPNDDQSTNEISLPFTLNFFGANFSSLFVNNNGNVTFGQALSDFTPTGLTGNNGLIPIIAPYWADVDTTGAFPGLQADAGSPPSGVVTFGVDTVNGHLAFGVDYENVGYFGSHTNKLNSFQLILIDRSDTGIAGAFDIEFNYDKIQWEAGDASNGADGLCTVASECAAVGYSNGTGTAGTNFQLNGSFAIGALLDNGPAGTSLIHNSLNSTMLGRYGFQVRNGVVGPTLTVTEAGAGTGTVTSSPAGINCPGTCSTSFASGAQITLTAAAGANSTFTGWSGGTCEGTGPCTFTITANASVTANFGTGTGNNFALTVSEAGTGTGTVMSAPVGISCPATCSANFASGTPVTLTASAADGSTFAGWTGGGCSGTGTCVVTVSAAVTVTATFNSGNSPVIISVGPGSSSTVNTVPGGSAVFGLVLTGQTGFTGTVQLTCSSPIASITCSIVPSSVTLNGTTTNVAIVVNTFCKGFIPNLGPTPGGFGTGTGLLLMALTLCGAAWRFKKQPRWALSFGLLIIFGVGMSACSNLAKSPSGTATPPGSYPLVVTATPASGAPSHVNLTLVVK